jgi:decaprenylphospho-beta-D-erythro-pentofuranosid-2-ulose 2-reductase
MSRILIVGGGSEIATAIAKSLYESNKGSEILLIGRSGASMDHAFAFNTEIFGEYKCRTIECDFSDPHSTATTVRNAVIDFQPTISVLAAGINIIEPKSLDTIQMGLVNFISMCAAGEEILDHYKNADKSSLIVLSSIASFRPRPTNYNYGSTKAGLDFWAKGAMTTIQKSTEIILIRLGKVSTTSSLGHPWAPFTQTPASVGLRIAELVGRGTCTIWIPRILGLVAFVLWLLPKNIWIKLSIRQSKDNN